MAVRKILRIGHPQLRLAAKAVERVGGETLSALVNDMLDTMQAFDGAGLAAPQIGVPLRVVIFGIDKNPRYPDAPPIPLTILLNPEFSPVDEAMDSAWEGCLSVPGMRGLVPRYTRIRYRGLGADGRELEREVEGFHGVWSNMSAIISTAPCIQTGSKIDGCSASSKNCRLPTCSGVTCDGSRRARRPKRKAPPVFLDTD